MTTSTFICHRGHSFSTNDEHYEFYETLRNGKLVLVGIGCPVCKCKAERVSNESEVIDVD